MAPVTAIDERRWADIRPATSSDKRMTEQPDRESSRSSCPIVVFVLDGQRYGVGLDVVERVLHMVAITPLPGRPDVVLGAVNLAGRVVAVIDVRRRLGLAAGDLGPQAQLLVAKTRRRIVALPVDQVTGVTEVKADRIASPEAVVPGLAPLAGVAALPDGLMLIHDLEAFLSLEEERQLDDALTGETA